MHFTYRHMGLPLLLALFTSTARAELPVSNLSTGDLIILRSTADKLTPVLGDEKDRVEHLKSTVKAPARTKFKVTHDKTGELTLAVKDVPCENDEVPAISAAAQMIGTIRVTKEDCALTPRVVEGHSYKMQASDLEDFGYRRLGFIYGGLVIPYKYFAHDKSLEPGTTMGPFLGYRLGQTGWGISVVATFAVTDIKVKVKDGTELKDRSFFGLSRGAGFMFDITKSETPFRAGIMWGRDRVGSNNVDVYPHDGRTWMAAQLGWEFGR